MSKSNICVIGLAKKFTDDVCERLSIMLELYYANVSQLLEYEIMDFERMEKNCGADYLRSKEISIIKRLCSYEQSLLNLEYSNLNLNGVLDMVKQNCLLIYLRISKDRFERELNSEGLSKAEKDLSLDVFDERDFACKKYATITIDCGEFSGDELTRHIKNEIINQSSNLKE